jgi:arylsulfatase A
VRVFTEFLPDRSALDMNPVFANTPNHRCLRKHSSLPCMAFFTIPFILIAVSLLGSTTQLHADSSNRPNIILILTDDHGWSQTTVSMDPQNKDARSDYLETPNMANLAKRGMRFTSGYSPAPLCTPTRRSILCGTSAARSGPEFKSAWVPKDHPTIPASLKRVDGNYRCAHFGKWGEQMISTPEECDYDKSDGMTGNITGGMPASLGVKGGHEDGPPHFIDNDDPKRTASVTTRAIDFIREQNEEGKPFYVQVSYYAQHLSVVTSDKMLAKYRAKGTPDRRYPHAWAAMMEELDTGIGRLVDTVSDLGIDDNTYVFLTADNGGRGSVPGGNNELPHTNIPLTGAKHSLYEGGIRVPMIAWGPGIKAGTFCRTPVVGYDFLPTFYDLAGGDATQLSGEIDGVSFKQLLTDPNDAPLTREPGGVIFHRPNRLFSAIRTDTHKLMLFWNRNGKINRSELYDLSANPTEEGNDQGAEHPATAEALQKQLLRYLKSVNAAKPKPRRR